MKLWIKILSVLLFLSLILLPKNIEARSGCCSHHGGVCGCRCCDGSSLSATCAPYYPSCGSTTTVKTVQPTSTPRPTSVPTKVPTTVPTKTPTTIPTSTPTPTVYPTETPILTPTIEPTKTEEISPTSQPQVLGETNDKKSTEPATASDFIIFFSVLGLIGFGIYKLFIKIKNKIFKKNNEI
jgi:hypothetical protein